MVNGQLIFLVSLSLVSSSFQDNENNRIDSQEESPLSDIANEILKEKTLENIGGIVSSFIQSGGAKQIMDGVLQNLASGENSGQLLESLGNVLSQVPSGNEGEEHRTSGKTSQDDVKPLDLLSGLTSLLSTMQDIGGENGQVNSAALLQGLGSLLGKGKNAGGGNNAEALLQGLGSFLESSIQQKNGKPGKNGNSAATLLQGLGSIIGSVATGNQDGNGAGALLQGLSSLLTTGQGDGENKLNPEMIGGIINMFANSQNEKKKPVKSSKSKPPKKARSGEIKLRRDHGVTKSKKSGKKGIDTVRSLASSFLGNKKSGGAEDFDLNKIFENFPLLVQMGKAFGTPKMKKYLDPLDDIIFLYKELKDPKKKPDIMEIYPRIMSVYSAYRNLVPSDNKSINKAGNQIDELDLSGLLNIGSAFLKQVSANNGNGGQNFMEYVPLIMNTISAFTGQELQDTADSHSGHSWSLPPMLEKVHVYFDTFMGSELGQKLQRLLISQKAFKVFEDEKGNFDNNKFQELIENHSFRKYWIQQVADKLVEFLIFVSDENVQKEYIDLSIMFANSVLVNSGFPKVALLDIDQPAKSITNCANHAAKKYLDADWDSTEYVEPAVQYAKDVLKMAKESLNAGSQSKELTEKLTDTINMEIIEPITRVNRAYRFAKSQPNCDRYVLCIVNDQLLSNGAESLPGLKKALNKGSSLVAGWFLSSHTGTSYWDLYDVIVENRNCQSFFNGACNGFHDEEIKATTEYIHNEL